MEFKKGILEQINSGELKVNQYNTPAITDEQAEDIIIDLFRGIFSKKYMRDKVKEKTFWISIKKRSNCLFSRRNGHVGKVLFNYSICIRLFGFNLI